MKLVKMAWVLGGMTAFGLGVLAEGCSSSNSGSTGTGACAALATCCATLGADATQCTPALNSMDEGTCSEFLTSVEMNGRCVTTPGSGTSTVGTSTVGTSTVGTSTGTSTPITTSGGTTVVGTSTTQPGGTGSTSTGASDAGADCEAPPAKVYAESKAGVYCPFSGVDGGKAETCAAGQHCCEPSAGTSTCEPTATACATGSTDWQCEGTPDCSGGTVCCGTGTIKEQAACGAYAAYPYISTFTGSACAASCSTYQICSQTSECPSGKTCVPVKPKGNTIGICQ